MKYYWRIVGKTRQDRVRNFEIRDELGNFHIEERLKIKHLKWFGTKCQYKTLSAVLYESESRFLTRRHEEMLEQFERKIIRRWNSLVKTL